MPRRYAAPSEEPSRIRPPSSVRTDHSIKVGHSHLTKSSAYETSSPFLMKLEKTEAQRSLDTGRFFLVR